jgi:hypothetical protein
VAIDFIGKDYRGYVQTDDFSAYNSRLKTNNILPSWSAGLIRDSNLFMLLTSSQKHQGKRHNPKSLADEAIRKIRQQYKVEKQA